MNIKNLIEPYQRAFSESKLTRKITSGAKQIGVQSVYMALLLLFAYKRKDTPSWAKKVVLGALGYLIAPLDLLPDLSPFVGYTDDLGILSFGLVTIAAYVDEEVRGKARGQLQRWFGKIDEADLKSIDDKL